MKKYIGTKTVMAEPMTMGEAYEQRGWFEQDKEVGRI